MTTTSDLCLMSLEGVAAMIKSKELSPVEATQTVLDRIERLDPQLNSYITVTAEAALASASAAEKEIAGGNYRGLLHGVPIAVKDLFATKGVRTTAGSKILADWVPDYDATVVAKLAAAGAISLGKLGMHEFAYGGTSDNPHYGAIHNPWNTAHSPAGSSGGSGAATAAGLAFATLGSDTGGSIRMPAAFNGVVGLMPTYGRASLYGAVPMAWSLDHPGPLARTVRDAAIVAQAISGRDPLDPTTEDRAVPDMLAGIEAGAQGLRIGVPRQYFFDGVDADVLRLVRKAITGLEGAGAEVRQLDYTGQTLPAIQYLQAYRYMLDVRASGADALLDGVDVLAVPTTQFTAPTIEAARNGAIAGRFHILTAIFDFTGQPVVAVPCGLSPDGLPVSISFVGRRWDEPAALRAARAYEQARGDFPAPPIAR
jgi:aspartyl-tRNA(Asn)/glutamyl-tRNA(Gln) amidotransferase subunit A